MEFDVEAAARQCDAPTELDAVVVIEVDPVPIDTTVHHVMPAIGGIVAELAGHGAILTNGYPGDRCVVIVTSQTRNERIGRECSGDATEPRSTSGAPS